ncbi:nuclear transport factor 2 family protein [Streptomyces sp. NBC_01320]|uniref:nuclear transport factor 2 family protein n=1 Tax=Streptomyces sp. NBC_01320 TaxID=2903824 RepID=UPI002E148583|nr:nuclear transport factor 2 family protein [Streptomyces sp. NBC_01320]
MTTENLDLSWAPAPRDVIQRFYKAVAEKDAAEITHLVNDAFAEDAVLTVPAPLPHGGVHEGRTRIARLFSAVATSGSALGPHNLRLIGVVQDEATAVARLAFEWVGAPEASPLPSRALELWQFRDDRVQSIDAYYWDTTALTSQGA